MYIAPIEFSEVRHWFLNVNTKFHHLCMFLTGNGDYNDVINEEILRNRYLIDRTTGNGICYFFCSSFGIDGDIDSFNSWNIRNRKLTKVIDNMLFENQNRRLSDHTPMSLQSEILREDVCDVYHISRSSLPALVFISRKEEIYLYPIKGFKDIKALLTPLGIVSDFLTDKKEIERRLLEIKSKKQEVDLKINRYEELMKAIMNAIPKSCYAQKLIDEIIDICRDNALEETTLKKMRNHPEKIRQILSIHHIDDVALSDKLQLLKACISQYRLVKKGNLPYLQGEMEKLSGVEYREWENDILNEEERLKDCMDSSIQRIKELELNVDADYIINQCINGKSGMWLIPVLKASQEIEKHIENKNDRKITLKCFIAGAKSLERERDAIISGINDQNIANKHSGRQIECYTFNNFDPHLTKAGQQTAYNNFIRDQANVVIFALDEVVGGITKQEFSIAVDTLKSKDYKAPIIFVFSNVKNEGKTENLDIKEVRDQVNLIHQYWIDYSSLEVLKLKLQLKIDSLYSHNIMTN